MKYAKKIMFGFGWLSLLKVYMKALTLGKIVVVARILSPHDLGLFGLAAVVLSLIEVMTETGINTFLIQKKDSMRRYIDTAWVISIVRGILITGTVIIASFFLKDFYGEPQLLSLLFIASAIPLIRGFINPSVIKFQKELRYHMYALFRSAVFTVEIGSAVVLSLLLHSAAALVIAMVIAASVEAVLSHVFLNPKPLFRNNMKQLKEILHFGKWLNMSGFFAFLGTNLDDLIVGKILGTTPLGYYQTGFNITQSTVGEVGDLASQTLFPVYSAVHKNTKELRKVLLSSVLPLAVLLLIPIAVILAFPSQLVTLVLGAKWLPIIPVLPWLFAAAYFQALNGAMYPIFLAVFKPQYSTVAVFLNLFVMVATIFPLANLYGLVGVGISVFLAKLSVQPLYLYFIWKTLWKKQ